MGSNYKLQFKLEFNDLEFDDLCEAVQEEYGTVSRATIEAYCKEKLSVTPRDIKTKGIK